MSLTDADRQWMCRYCGMILPEPDMALVAGPSDDEPDWACAGCAVDVWVRQPDLAIFCGDCWSGDPQVFHDSGSTCPEVTEER